MPSVNVYSDPSCGSAVPVAMIIVEDSSCSSSECTTTVLDGVAFYTTTSCPSDDKAYAADVYGSSSYVLMDVYNDANCDSYYGALVFHASGVCEVIPGTWNEGVITTMNADGTIQMEFFWDISCLDAADDSFLVTNEMLTSHSCDYTGAKFYSNSAGSATDGTEDSSGLGVGAIVGIVAGILVVLLVAGIVFWRCRREKAQHQEPVQTPATMEQAVASSGHFHVATISQ
ncbi:hypothetical protein BBJ28_00024240 [Nothophytophthora sp. Chile5]|nr:hypothetical protein BBJ28_00024240 [Nothophytophthora sp. Chile5]